MKQHKMVLISTSMDAVIVSLIEPLIPETGTKLKICISTPWSVM
jgi:hypothetical protein